MQTDTKGTTAPVRKPFVMRRMKYVYITSLLLSLVASSAFADVDYVDCTGKVTTLSVTLDNEAIVTVGLTGAPSATYLCSVKQNYNGVPPVVCRTMFAALMTAKATGKQVTIRFYDHRSCSDTDIFPWRPAGRLGWTNLLFD